MKLFTEEDVKLKIVLPFLNSLGFQENELFFEKSFTLTIGRNCHKVSSEEQHQIASGRLDILVTRNGNNLFIVEVKKDGAIINDKDIQQATSYARLVHPLAPFAIVTNGKDFHIYDSISREEIPKDNFPLKSHYDVSILEEVRYEALKYFLGYSKENLLIFCREQVNEGMRTLKGSKDNPSKKFIPALYTPRKDLSQAFAQFINNETVPVFAMVGDSGSGKTSSMCYMALELLGNGNPVLFYKANNLVCGIIQSIADDFNWSFSPQHSDIQIIKRVEEIIGPNNLVIFIEAIDEWNHLNKVEIINNFISKICKRKIKLVLSCKTNMWPYYLDQSDTPTELSELIYDQNKNRKGFYLGEFSQEEFTFALKRYREFYQFNGAFEKQVLEECKRIPFLLRVCFEVAQGYKLKHLTFSCIEFFHEYYNRIIKKVGNDLVARRTLKGVAKSLLDNNCNSIDIDIVEKELGLDVNQNIMPSLFEYNVLEIVSEPTTNIVKFYFDKFRDYIIAFHVLRMDKNPSPFDNLLPLGVHKDVINFFYPLANINQKITVDKKIRDNAEKYLSFYIDIVNDNFKEFKQSFIPHTNGDIGFIGELNILNEKLMYGFRALENPDEERILFNLSDNPIFGNNYNISFLYGAKRLHSPSSANFFHELDIEKAVLKNEIVPQLKDIIKFGLLNEKNNVYLLKELIIALVLQYQSKYFKIKYSRNLSKSIPINFEEIEYNMGYEKAYRYFEHKLIDKKIENGEIELEWIGSIVSYHCSLSQEDLEYIHLNAEIAAKNKLDIGLKIYYLGSERIEKTFLDTMHNLREQGFNSIDELILPEKDRFSSKWVWGDYSDDMLVEYVLKVYQLYLQEYKIIIETNFGFMKEIFKLYAMMPVKCFITIKRGSEHCWAEFDMCHNKDTTQNEVIMVSGDELILNEDAWKVIYLGEEFDLIQYWHSNISKFFSGGLNNHLNVNTSVGSTPIRNLVYEQIKSEIEGVIDLLFKKYQVARE